MAVNNALNITATGIVKHDGAGAFTATTTTDHAILVGDAANAITNIGPLTDGQVVIGSTGIDPVAAAITATAGQGISVTLGAGSITLAGIDASTAVKGVVELATDAEVKTGTDTVRALVPSSFTTYMADLDLTGFVSWAAAGPYFDDTTLGTFQLLVGGTGYIQGRQVTWAAQNIAGMTAGNTYYIYIDSSGTIGKTSTRTDALFTDNIVLFECLRDSTAAGNNQVTVKENHPYNYPATVSNYEHDNIGTLIENNNNGANITLNGTQKIQINGADVLSDHGLETTIPDSAAAAVTFNQYFTLAGGAWALDTASDTFTGTYNNAGAVAALGASKFGVYTLYVSKDNLNSSTPVYFAVLDTSQYNNLNAADTAIATGATAKISNELTQLEMCQLGYIIYSQASNSIVQVIISKTTLKQTLSTAGTNTAALVNTSTTNFNGWLSTADTTVQQALDTLDDSQRFTEETGAAANLVINKAVIANRATLVTLTLPTVAKIGDTIEVVGKGAGMWSIAQNAGQTIHFTSGDSTTGVGGSVSATGRYDALRLVCTIANTDFTALSMTGNLTVV